jgi:hypothetical protein
MSLTLSGIPDGQKKGQSKTLCPSVYSPASALESLSSVALSSGQATKAYHLIMKFNQKGGALLSCI